MFDFEEALRRIAEQTVLCVGDVMLDDFVYGDVTRISPEAPTPVLTVGRSEVEIGGAGNVARNIAALGAHCIFVGLIGNDEAGRVLTDKLGKLGSITSELVVDNTRPTTRKVRFVSEHHSTHLLRADWETADAGQRGKRSRDHRLCRSGAAESRRGGAVRLCQRRAHRARHSRHHRGGAAPRQTGRGRSQRPRLPRLSRRDADHAECQGAGRRGASAGDHRGGDRGGRRRAGAPRRQRSRAGHPQRSRHEPSRRRSPAGPYSRLSGQSARCFGRRRHRRRGHGGALGNAGALRGRHAGGQCRRRGRRRQARHVNGLARRIAPPHPARGIAGTGGQDRVRLVGARRAA